MSDRANVFVRTGDSGVYLYTHWRGSALPDILQEALNSPIGRCRWSDESYLARIIFCAMVGDEMKGETGFGIATYAPDGDDRVLEVSCKQQTITQLTSKQRWSFVEFCGLTEDELDKVWG